MAIDFSKYIKIISGVGGASSVANRELIGRIFTENALVPTGSIVEFTDLASVLLYFGASSEEYKRASFYFGWVSKTLQTAKKISFARWANADTKPQIHGAIKTQSVSSYTSITDGSFHLSIGASAYDITGISFVGNATLADVASDIQTAIRAETGGGAMFTSATVTWNSTRGSFDFEGGVAGNAVITIGAAATGTNILSLIGWSTGAIVSNGMATQSITTLLTDSTAVSNNFGSYAFIPSLTESQIIESATWNDAQNVEFLYCVPVSASNAAAYSAALIALSGNVLVLQGVTGEYHEMMPMTILAATNYNVANGVQNYMYQSFALTPTVTDTTTSNTYDNLRVNYYGQTQTAGQGLSFFQRSDMNGGATDPISLNVYANEMWLKDAIGVALMSLLMSQGKISANDSGLGLAQSSIIGIVNQALNNGVISAGKTLSNTQKAYITSVSNDSNAWVKVQTQGYWLNTYLSSAVNGAGATEYTLNYNLIYSKDDTVRAVNGTDILI